MPFQSAPRTPSVLASALAAAGIMLTAASCASHITPLSPGPAAPTKAPSRHLGSPIILQPLRSQPATAAGTCPADWFVISAPGSAGTCYRKLGTPVTITAAGISPVSRMPQAAPGQPAAPAQYGFWITVPAAHVAAVTAVIRQSYDARGALAVDVAGRIWQAPQADAPFPGRQLEVAFLSKNQALQLYRILVPPS